MNLPDLLRAIMGEVRDTLRAAVVRGIGSPTYVQSTVEVLNGQTAELRLTVPYDMAVDALTFSCPTGAYPVRATLNNLALITTRGELLTPGGPIADPAQSRGYLVRPFVARGSEILATFKNDSGGDVNCTVYVVGYMVGTLG